MQNNLQTYLQQYTTMCVHVGPRIFRLSLLQQNIRHQLVQIWNQTEQWIFRHVFQRKLTLTFIAWVSFAQNSVAIARNNLKIIREQLPHKMWKEYIIFRFYIVY